VTTLTQYDEALSDLERTAAACRSSGNLEEEARVTAEMGRLHFLRGTPREGIARLRSMLDRMPDDAPPDVPAALFASLAPLYWVTGRYTALLAAATEGASLAEAAEGKASALYAETEVWLGIALLALERIEEGMQVLEAAIPLAEAAGDLMSVSRGYNSMAATYQDRGEVDREAPYLERALDAGNFAAGGGWTPSLAQVSAAGVAQGCATGPTNASARMAWQPLDTNVRWTFCVHNNSEDIAYLDPGGTTPAGCIGKSGDVCDERDPLHLVTIEAWGASSTAQAHLAVDVGGSHGLYTIALCRRHAEMSAVIYDWPDGVAAARREIARAGLSDRITTLTGDFLTGDLGAGYDVALLGNIIHGQPPPAIRDLLWRLHGAMNEGGTLLILDQVGMREPFTRFAGYAAALTGLLLLNELGGGIYPYAEVRAWLRETGYGDVRRRRLLRAPGNVLIQASR